MTSTTSKPQHSRQNYTTTRLHRPYRVMPSLLDMPTELRQQILLLALPDTERVDFPWPAQITSLFLLNKSLFNDMKTVMETWSLLHYISSPLSIALTQNTRLYAPKLSRICLDLFHASEVDRVYWTYDAGSEAPGTHPGSIASWAAAVEHLPHCAKEIYLDITPAPAAKRQQHHLIFTKFLRHKRASRVFLAGHVEDVAALVRRIDVHYCGCVRIILIGTLSTRSAFFVNAVSVSADREVEFLGTWVDTQLASLSEAVLSLTSRKLLWQGKQRGDEHPLVWLRVVIWDRRTGFLFARLADEGLKKEAVGDVKLIAEFRAEDGELVLEHTNNLRRAFQHRVAADLDFNTISEGAEGERHVIVRR